MSRISFILFLAFYGFNLNVVTAQCSNSNFNVPSSVCLGSRLSLLPEDISQSNVQWDFCPGDLILPPNASVLLNSPATGASFKVKLMEDNGFYYGFFTSRFSKKLYRLDFGGSITNEPVLNDLGDLGINTDSWLSVEIVKELSTYYGFVIDANNKLYRFQVGASIADQPQNAELIYSSGLFNLPIDMVLISQGNSKYIFISNFNVGNITRIRFPSSFNGAPSSVLVDNISLPGSNGLVGIAFIQECGNWYSILTSRNEIIYKIEFQNDLSTPTPLISQLGFSPPQPAGVSVVLDNGKYHAFVLSLTSSLYRIDFGSSMSNTPGGSSDLGNLGILSGVWAYSMISAGSEWMALACENGGNRIFKIQFPSNCFSSTRFSTDIEPLIVGEEVGNFFIELTVIDAVGQVSSTSKPLTIISSQAPDISFTSQNICANNDVSFTSQSTSGDITDYNWDFGDANTSIAQDPTHQYTAAGDYEVALQVTASNGCNNLAKENITIYNEPLPNFIPPAASPICTNQEYLFINTSIFDSGSNPTWQWEVNGSAVASTQDLSHFISSPVQQDVKLIASIPGCSNEITKSILTVEEGPFADFTFANDCVETSIDFTNTTSGTVSAYSWDFGDTNTSSQVNGVNTYTSFGQYDVTLTASNLAGCNNSSTQQITIYSKPQPDFSLDLPPFSCSGSVSQFNDLTPSPADSNLDSWAWTFGDSQNGTSTLRNAQYTYNLAGQYDVDLTVTTNFGCSASTQKTITIAESPSSDFTNTAACLNQATIFTPLATSSISAWQWKIGSATYNQQTPTHVFGVPTTYNAELTTTGANGCISVSSKSVFVPIAPNVDFIIENACAGQETILSDASTTFGDAALNWTWEFSNLNAVSGQSTTFSYPTSGNFPTKLTVTTTSGCSYSISKNVAIASSPVASFTATPQSGTPPLVVTVVNTSANSASQLWSVVGGGASSDATTQFSFDQLGDYVIDLTVVNAAGCVDSESKLISVVIPALDVELSGLTLVPAGEDVYSLLATLINRSNTPVSNVIINVDLSGKAEIRETIETSIQPNATFSKLLATSVVLTDNAPNFICAEIVVDGDINDGNNRRCESLNSLIVLSPSPNPATTQINVDWIAVEPGDASLTIFDTNGRRIFENIYTDYSIGLNHLTLPTENINPGIYFILFVSNNIRRSFPVVIQK